MSSSAKRAASTTTTPSSTSTSSSSTTNAEETQNVEQVKIKSEPIDSIDLTETESYKTLIEHEINDLLAEKLSQLILDNKLSIDELDDNAYSSIKRMNNLEESLNILNDFEQANDDKLKDGRINYLCELIKCSEERINGETASSLTPNGESSSSSSSNPSPAKSTTQQYQNSSNSQQNQLEDLKKKCDEISQRTGKFFVFFVSQLI